MKLSGYDFDEHLAEIARAKGGGAEPAELVKASSGAAGDRGRLLLANARGVPAEPQGPRKSASVMEVGAKKEPLPARPIRGSVPSSGSGGAPAGRAQKNEQKYNQALKSAMKSGGDAKEAPSPSQHDKKLDMKKAANAYANNYIRQP